MRRGRLKQMVASRLDRRLAAWVGLSDIVQEALRDAEQRLDGYVRKRPSPFYPWLHRLTRERLAQVRRWRFSPARDAGQGQHVAFGLPDQSAAQLAELPVEPPTIRV